MGKHTEVYYNRWNFLDTSGLAVQQVYFKRGECVKHKPQHAKHEKKLVPGDTITALCVYSITHPDMHT